MFRTVLLIEGLYRTKCYTDSFCVSPTLVYPDPPRVRLVQISREALGTAEGNLQRMAQALCGSIGPVRWTREMRLKLLETLFKPTSKPAYPVTFFSLTSLQTPEPLT